MRNGSTETGATDKATVGDGTTVEINIPYDWAVNAFCVMHRQKNNSRDIIWYITNFNFFPTTFCMSSFTDPVVFWI